jgi:hypothetical protein
LNPGLPVKQMMRLRAIGMAYLVEILSLDDVKGYLVQDPSEETSGLGRDFSITNFT